MNSVKTNSSRFRAVLDFVRNAKQSKTRGKRGLFNRCCLLGWYPTNKQQVMHEEPSQVNQMQVVKVTSLLNW